MIPSLSRARARRVVVPSLFSLAVAFGIGSCGGGDGKTVIEPPPSVQPTTSTVSVSSTSVASGSTVVATLQAKDASGNNLSASGLIVTFTLGAGTSNGTFSAVTYNGNGAYSATFTGTTAGSARTVGATIDGTAVTTTMPSLTVTPGPFSATQSQITVSASNIQTGSTATLTARLKDAATNDLTAGGATVVFTKGSGTSDGNIGAVTDNANGTYSATFTATTTGSARSIGATVNSIAITSTLPTITVTAPAGPISAATSVVTVSVATVTSGTTAAITLQAKDASGTNLTSGGSTVAFSLGATGTSTGTIGTVSDNNNGTYTATLTGVLAGTARGISATIGGNAVTTAEPTFTVVAGAASASTSVATVSTSSIASATSATITLQAKDAAGNSLTAGGATVAFSKGSGTSDGAIGTVSDVGNGTYTATFTGTTAGSARAILATLNGSAVTTASPTITVVAGTISGQSIVTVSASNIEVNASATLTLTAKDANGNAITTGGATVAFTKSTGTSDGTFSAVTDNANGTYTATFTGTTAGSERAIGATVNATAVTTALPGIAVYTKGLTLSTSSVLANATAGLMGTQQLVGVFANGGQTAAGLSAAVSYTNNGIAACTANWMGAAPVFDVMTASPAAIVSFTPDATTLGVYSCSATVTISSTTPGYASQQFTVTLAVARGAVAQTAVNLVTMGNASNNTVQTLTPDVRILITNGGRGIATGLHASVDNQHGVGTTTPWLTAANLSWDPPSAPTDSNARTAPRTLVVHPEVKPFNADAIIHVTGNGIPNIDIPVSVLFNVDPELVTNPRGAAFTAFAGGPNTPFSVVAFNQNRTVPDSLRNFQLASAISVPWLSASFARLLGPTGMDTAATITLTADPSTLLADSIYSTTVNLKAERCTTGSGVCATGGAFRTFDLPVTLTVERGLVLSVANATLFAPVGTVAVTKDVSITNGGSTAISGLSAGVGGATWLAASFTTGTAAPTTLRLTANPTGLTRGTVLTTTVTVSASTPTGVASKSFLVTFRVY